MTIFFITEFGDTADNFKKIDASTLSELVVAVKDKYGLSEFKIGEINDGNFVELKVIPQENKTELVFKRNKKRKRDDVSIPIFKRVPDDPTNTFLGKEFSDYFPLITELIVVKDTFRKPKEGYFRKGVQLPLGCGNSSDIYDFCMPARNPLINTEEFKHQIQKLKEGFDSYDTIVGCGVSGAGKSTLGIALGKESFFVIYTEISTQGSTNIVHGDGCTDILQHIIKDASDQTRVENLLKLDLLARLILLFLLLNDGQVTTPLQWLNVQFNESQNITTILNSLLQDNFNPSSSTFDALFKWIKGKTKKSILLVRDESQILTKGHFGEYDNFLKNKKWNLLQFSSSVYAQLGCKQFILGTYLHIAHAQSLASATGGKPMNPKGVFLYFDFPFITKEEVLPMLERVLDLEDIDNEYLALAKNKLYGRCRLSCGFISYYCNYTGKFKSLSKSEAFGSILNEYIDFAIEKFADYLVSIKDVKTFRIQTNHVDMLKRYFSPGVSLVTEDDVFQFGIIPFVRKNAFLPVQRDELKSLQIQINKTTEPLLLLGMIRYFTKEKDTNVYDVFVKSVLGMSGNLGNEMDFLVPLCFMKAKGLTLNKFIKDMGCDCALPAWCNNYIVLNVDKITYGDIEAFLDASSNAEKTSLILPPNDSGSDGVFTLYSDNERVAFVTIGNCLRNRGIGNAKIEYQMMKTDLRNQYLTVKKSGSPIKGIPKGFKVSCIKKAKDCRTTIEAALKKANGNQVIFSVELPRRKSDLQPLVTVNENVITVIIDERNGKMFFGEYFEAIIKKIKG